MKQTIILLLLLVQYTFAQNPNNITISYGAQHLSTNNSSMHLIVGEPIVYEAPSTLAPSIKVGFHYTLGAATASSTDLTFFTDDTTVQTGTTIDYALRIKNVAAPIGAFTINIAYDDTKLNYLSNVQAIPGLFIGNSTPGILTLNFVDPSSTGIGQQWTDSTALVLLRFYVNMGNGACTSLSLSPSPAAGVYDNNFAPVNYTSTFDSICSINPVLVEGMVKTEIGVPMPWVALVPSLSVMNTDTTNGLGNYRVQGVANTSFIITPNREQDINYANGINVLDLLLIRRHILTNGVNSPLSTPYKLIAANVSRFYPPYNDVVINSLDMLMIQRVIINQQVDFNGKQYVFIPDDYVFPNPASPFSYPTSRQYNNLSIDQSNEDYIGVKLGDVNDSWDNTLKSGSSINTAILKLDSCALLTQGTGIITLYAEQMDSTVGWQGTIIATDSTVIEIDSIWAIPNPNFTLAVSKMDKTTCTFSSYSSSGYAEWIPAGTPLVRMQVKAIGIAGQSSTLEVNSAKTPLYVYDSNLNPMTVQTSSGWAEIVNVLGQPPLITDNSNITIFPNPTEQSVKVQFSTPVRNTTSLLLLDILGKQIWIKEIHRGASIVTIPMEKLPSGSYLLQIQNEQELKTLKLEKL